MAIYTHIVQIDALLLRPGHSYPCLLMLFAGCLNDCCIDLPGMETIDLTDKGKQESCVLVDNKLQRTVSFRPRKYKSYKVTSLLISFPSALKPELSFCLCYTTGTNTGGICF